MYLFKICNSSELASRCTWLAVSVLVFIMSASHDALQLAIPQCPTANCSCPNLLCFLPYNINEILVDEKDELKARDLKRYNTKTSNDWGGSNRGNVLPAQITTWTLHPSKAHGFFSKCCSKTLTSTTELLFSLCLLPCSTGLPSMYTGRLPSLAK